MQFTFKPFLRWGTCVLAIALLAACGGGGGGTEPAPSPQPQPQPQPNPTQAGISAFIGDESVPARVDAAGRDARFLSIRALALDAAGNAYVIDQDAIRKLTPQGGVSTVFTSSGNACYPAPSDLAVGADGDLYVLDASGNLCRQPLAGGVTQVTAGTDLLRARFLARAPGAQAFYVASAKHIWRVGPSGAPAPLAGQVDSSDPARDGTGSNARFQGIVGITADAAGNLFVVDQAGVRKVTPEGVVTTLAIAKLPSNPFAQQLHVGIAADTAGNAYVPDLSGMQAADDQPFGGSITRVSPAGQTSTVAGSGGLFRSTPAALAFDAQGNIVYTGSRGVGRLSPAGAASTWAGRFLAGPGAPVDEAPLGLDSAGNLITVSDPFRTTNPIVTLATPLLRKIAPDGTRLPYAPGRDVLGLAPPDAANRFFAIALDAQQNVYASYTRGSRGTSGPASVIETEIYRVAPDGSATRIYFATPDQAGFAAPVALAGGPDGSLYFVDGLRRAIRKLNRDGSITAVTADNTVSDAAVTWGVHLVIGNAGQVFLLGNAMDPAVYIAGASQQLSVLARLADTPPPVGAPVDLTRFSGMTLDARGNLYVVDGTTLRKIAADGTLSTVAGTPGTQQITLGSPGTLLKSHSPVVAADGTVYLRSGNAIVRIRLP